MLLFVIGTRESLSSATSSVNNFTGMPRHRRGRRCPLLQQRQGIDGPNASMSRGFTPEASNSRREVR